MIDMTKRVILFLILNFGALAIGGLFTGKGVPSDWYLGLNKAPWTPPGWVFGFAWTTIMICFSFYMSFLWSSAEDKKVVIGLFTFQWILNVAWNPLFFHLHQVGVALLDISLLTMLVGFMVIHFWSELKMKSLLLLPYFIWLLIATSLNGYIYLNN